MDDLTLGRVVRDLVAAAIMTAAVLGGIDLYRSHIGSGKMHFEFPADRADPCPDVTKGICWHNGVALAEGKFYDGKTLILECVPKCPR